MTARTLLAAAALLVAGAAQAVPVAWTDWTAISSGQAIGTMGGVGVTATVNSGGLASTAAPHYRSQTSCGFNYWTGTAYTNGTVDNGPTACEQVGLVSPTSITVTFSQAIDSLYMALLSIGQPTLTVTYAYGQAFTVDSEGAGYWGDGTYSVSGNDLVMNEFHGVVRFTGPVTSLTFSTSPTEDWHAFTFGAAVPEPGSLALVGAALLGLGAAQRVARRRTASR